MLCVCAHTHKEKRPLVVFLCGFPGKNKPNYIQIPSLPSLGAFSVMQGVGCWTNPVRRNTPSSSNHHHGCTTSWQEERNDQQKNINRWWKAAWISCLNKQSEERLCEEVCVCVCVCVSVTVWLRYVITVRQVQLHVLHSWFLMWCFLLKYLNYFICATYWHIQLHTRNSHCVHCVHCKHGEIIKQKHCKGKALCFDGSNYFIYFLSSVSLSSEASSLRAKKLSETKQLPQALASQRLRVQTLNIGGKWRKSSNTPPFHY